MLYSLGTIYLAAGKAQEAELTFRHICAAIPGAASCPYGLALVAARSGDKQEGAGASSSDAVRRKLPNPDQIAKRSGLRLAKGRPGVPEDRRLAPRTPDSGGRSLDPSAQSDVS